MTTWAGPAGWALVVLLLVLVNTGGNVVLAVVLAAVVGVLSRRIDTARRRERGRGPGQAE